jgi:hypothetical protein
MKSDCTSRITGVPEKLENSEALPMSDGLPHEPQPVKLSAGQLAGVVIGSVAGYWLLAGVGLYVAYRYELIPGWRR